MVSDNTHNPNLNDENIEKLNNDFLEILSELTNIVSMEEKYLSAGIKMKNTSVLDDLMERMSALQVKMDENK
jgi:hypothetical protein